jgi:hypothetical protein
LIGNQDELARLIKKYHIIGFWMRMSNHLAIKMGWPDWLVFIKEYQTIDFQIWMHDWLATDMGWLDWLKNTKLLVFECESWIDWQLRWICGSKKYLRERVYECWFQYENVETIIWVMNFTRFI